MFCQKCGNKLEGEEVDYCSKCGNPTSEAVLAKRKLPAPMLKRFLNYVIDRFAKYIVFFIILGIAGATHQIILNVIAGLFFVSYHIVCESVWQKTLGKVITKTKVVDMQGNKPKFWTIVLRSICRMIPFDFISFFFGGYPVGWHDSLSKTFVVASDMTPEDVQKIDIAEARNTKGNNTAGVVIGIIVGGMVLIAIVGILASIVLASLGEARAKAEDAKIYGQISSMQSVAKAYSGKGAEFQGGECAATPDTLFDTNGGLGNLFPKTGAKNSACYAVAGLPSKGAQWAVAWPESKTWACADFTGIVKQNNTAGEAYTESVGGTATSAINVKTGTCN